jgi:hypothetical protein
MKVALVVILCATFAFATPRAKQIPVAASEPACGPENVKVELEMGSTDPPHLESGKALVDVKIWEFPNCAGGSTGRSPT